MKSRGASIPAAPPHPPGRPLSVLLYKLPVVIHAGLYLKVTRQVYNLFQEPVEQPPLGFSIAEEKIRQF